MKLPDLDRERSEKKLTIKEFCKCYNEGLPEGHPGVTLPILKTFTASNTHLFKNGDEWTLDVHRKKVMDWLPSYMRSNARES